MPAWMHIIYMCVLLFVCMFAGKVDARVNIIHLTVLIKALLTEKNQ